MSDDRRTQSGISVTTLVIAGAASATAAVVIPMLWRPGTVFAAAMTPIFVALVSEALKRPVDTVTSVRPRRGPRGTEVLDRTDEAFDPLAPPSAEELEALPTTRPSRPAVHRRRPLTARQWKLALATGLVAFAGAAAVVTASDLVAGDSISGGGGRTTFFSGSTKQKDADDTSNRGQEERQDRRSEEPTPTPTETPEATATPTPTVTPEATATPAPPPAEAPAAPAPAEPTPVP